MKNILLCAPVHEKEHIFIEYLKSLRSLEIPEGYAVTKMFILHNCEHLGKHINKDLNEIYQVLNDDVSYQKNDRTHIWQDKNFKAVVTIKNYLINAMLSNNFDYIFYVDSDLILHPKTLLQLLSTDKDMVSNIFWTHWDKSNANQGELPNCWMRDDYGFELADLKAWKQKGTYRVGMTGACTLIKRKVLENPSVNWNPINNISFSLWEDRAFCIRVAIAGFEIWTDTNYPALHLYREEMYQEYMKGVQNE
jgi:GT2 family glycosyltransferase